MLEAPYHAAAVFQIRDIFGRHVRTLKRSKPIVESDLLVLFDSAGTTVRVGPDIFVAFGVDQPPASFRVPRDRNLSMLVLEVLSPSTYETDQSKKMLSYAEMGAAEYGCLTRLASCKSLGCGASNWQTAGTCPFLAAASPRSMLCMARSSAQTCT